MDPSPFGGEDFGVPHIHIDVHRQQVEGIYQAYRAGGSGLQGPRLKPLT